MFRSQDANGLPVITGNITMIGPVVGGVRVRVNDFSGRAFFQGEHRYSSSPRWFSSPLGQILKLLGNSGAKNFFATATTNLCGNSLNDQQFSIDAEVDRNCLFCHLPAAQSTSHIKILFFTHAEVYPFVWVRLIHGDDPNLWW